MQKFDWPCVTFGKGFLLSAYENKKQAQALELDLKEDEALYIPDDFEKIEKLLEVDIGYRIFLNKMKNKDWEKRMLKH